MMNSVQDALIQKNQQLPENLNKYDWIKTAKKIAELANKQLGNLTGYDCKECLNRGGFERVDDNGYKFFEPCKCMKIRKSLKRIEKSGLSDLLKAYKFDNYKVEYNWQVYAIRTAKEYAINHSGWFYISGTPGTGKTHLCTAICGKLLNDCIPVRYLIWRDFAPKATSLVMDTEKYQDLLEPLKHIKVLYIDDFLKTIRGKNPTDGEVKLAYELINSRYYNRNIITIISSELSIKDIIGIDGALGSRIYQRAKEHYLELGKRENWRLR